MWLERLTDGWLTHANNNKSSKYIKSMGFDGDTVEAKPSVKIICHEKNKLEFNWIWTSQLVYDMVRFINADNGVNKSYAYDAVRLRHEQTSAWSVFLYQGRSWHAKMPCHIFDRQKRNHGVIESGNTLIWPTQQLKTHTHASRKNHREKTIKSERT